MYPFPQDIKYRAQGLREVRMVELKDLGVQALLGQGFSGPL